MDFGKFENIIFVAVSSVIAAVLLTAVIIVVAKGKRKCRALDVVLRIFSALTLVVSAVLLTCSIMTGLDGSFRISVTENNAVMTAGGSSFDLPLVSLFIALSTKIGQDLMLAVLLLSLVALICDCLIANKKSGKKKTVKEPAKTPEQIKREREIEKIRKLADSAVKQSNAAASEPVPEPAVSAASTETDEPDFDWRVDNKPKQTEFIGLRAPDPSDSFDTFDDENIDAEQPEAIIEENDLTADDVYDRAESVATDVAEDRISDTDAAADVNEYHEPDMDSADAADEYGEPEPETVNAVDDREQQNVDDDAVDDEVKDYGATAPNFDGYTESADVNRDIYIPEIRTIVRRPEPQKRDKKDQPPKKRTAKAKTAAKPAAKKTAKPAAKPAAKKTAKPVPKPTAKKSVKPAAKSPAAKPETQKAPESIRNTSLPVTRRYVILDRTNAVNIFGNYLKERDREEKERLESSISTIIIK